MPNSFEGHPVIITEDRFQDLVNKEKRLAELLAAYPEVEKGQKITPALKKTKTAFAEFVRRVDEVLSSPEIAGVFQIAHVHGCPYKGPSLAKDILAAKKALGVK